MYLIKKNIGAWSHVLRTIGIIMADYYQTESCIYVYSSYYWVFLLITKMEHLGMLEFQTTRSSSPLCTRYMSHPA